MRPIPLPEPALAAGRLVLRPWAAEDLAVVIEAGQDALVQRFRTSVPTDASSAEAWLDARRTQRESGERLELAIARSGAQPVGSISIEAFEQHNATLSFWVARRARGRGVATQAVRLLANWAFAELRLLRLAMHVDPDNAASRRVVVACGFVEEGRLRSH